ncbi:hypothetical protein RFI_00242 [Reticulomyxa filosa]|uniref:Uncharacterized protein n=1 Tax=Reticulomyxa filosa TaxID=46433 RepID=X6PE87_RETFI|nr:hypothetical protein RFI_00242 [Reticulomyxa filosa]|eukprot:ETO36820.1 hypothetical protein RFI_00242 [Reticulomyxa filosa]
MIDNANKRRPSVKIKPIDRRNLKRLKLDDDNIENERIQSNKKQKTQILQRCLMIVPNLSEKKEEELNDENIWKESKKTRKDWFLQLKAYTFSQSWKTLFVHFQSQMKVDNRRTVQFKTAIQFTRIGQ